MRAREQVFVQTNQGGEDTSVLEHLDIIGTPRETSDMSQFKRVAGKAGEADH